MTFFISCENGLVSRFNSGDLAGKCADFNSQQKIALRAENIGLSIPKPERLIIVQAGV